MTYTSPFPGNDSFHGCYFTHFCTTPLCARITNMNQYIIQQKIKTISSLGFFEKDALVPMIINDIEFNQWDFSIPDGCKGDAWVAKGKEGAGNYREAFANFRKKLSKIVPKVAFVSQCYMDYVQESFLVFRINDNPDKITFMHHVSSRGATGLMFMEDEKENLDKIDLDNNEFFWYMNDCYNTTGYIAKLLLMFAALESLAGKEIKTDDEGNEYENYNKDTMKEILGNGLFNEIYGKDGLRHKLTHGEYIDPSFSGTNYVESLHKLILEYFNKKYKTKLDTGITHPQRHPFGNSYYMNAFIKPKEGNNIELKEIIEEFDIADSKNSQSLDSFEHVFDKKLDKSY